MYRIMSTLVSDKGPPHHASRQKLVFVLVGVEVYQSTISHLSTIITTPSLIERWPKSLLVGNQIDDITNTVEDTTKHRPS